MTLILIMALIAAAVALAFLACTLLILREEMAALRIEYESEQAWADEYRRQADALAAELAAVRRDYAALLAAHHRSTIPVLGGAWRAGLGREGGRR